MPGNGNEGQRPERYTMHNGVSVFHTNTNDSEFANEADIHASLFFLTSDLIIVS